MPIWRVRWITAEQALRRACLEGSARVPGSMYSLGEGMGLV